MTIPLDEILSGDGDAVSSIPETTTSAVAEESSLEQIGESQSAQDQDATTTPEQGEAQIAEAERERRRGSGAQLDAAEDRHRQELERVRKEEAERWRRTMASEVPRQVQEALLKAQQQQQPPPTVFDDEAGAIKYHSRQDIDPELRAMREAFHVQARILAEQKYGGPEKVSSMLQAVDSAAQKGVIDPSAYASIINSPNAIMLALSTYERELHRIDPEAYEKQQEIKVLEKYGLTPETAIQRQQNGGTQQAQASTFNKHAMPTDYSKARNIANRSAGPPWAGPSPLQDIFNQKRSG